MFYDMILFFFLQWELPICRNHNSNKQTQIFQIFQNFNLYQIITNTTTNNNNKVLILIYILMWK